MAALLVLAPLAAVILLNLPLGRFCERAALGVAAALCLALALVALLVPEAWWARDPSLPRWLDVASALNARLHVDAAARVVLLATGVVGLCAASVARYTLRDAGARFRFANLLALSLVGLDGVVVVRDLLELYAFLELTAVVSLVLIGLEGRKAALEGAFKYLVLSAVATSMMLGGLALLFMLAGDTSFDAVAAALRGARPGRLVLAAIALYVSGLSVKAGLVPFHGWLPDAYAAAPAATSVLLAGIVTKACGVFTLLRLVEGVFGHGERVRAVLLAAGLASIVVGALGALGQKDLKRLFAYSSIGQVGYVALGVGAGPGLGVAAAMFHLFNHAVAKSLLFVNAAALEREGGTRDVDALGGVAARMPVTGATATLATLSTAGVPPLSGFWSKLLVVIAVWRSGHPAVAALAVLATALTLAYLLSVQRRVFFGKVAAGCAGLREASGWDLAPALLLAALALGLGLAAPWLFGTFLLPVGSIL